MRILVVSNYALPHIGGIEILVDQELRALSAAGHEVVLVTSDAAAPVQPQESPAGARIVRVGAWHGPERWQVHCPVFFPKLIPVLWAEASRCDVIHVHGFVSLSSAAALVIGILRGRQCILSEHAGVYYSRSKLARAIAWIATHTVGRLIARGASRIICYSPAVRSFLARLGGSDGKVQLLFKPIDTSLFKPPSETERRAAKAALRWDPTRPTVLFVGRLHPDKGTDLLLAAANPGAYNIVFCGPGDASLLGPLPRPGVDYLPARPAEQMPALYRAADVLVLPTLREGGLPLVALEALSCGLPVVLNSYPGSEFYQSLHGLWFSDPAPAALRDAIDQALSHGRVANATESLPMTTDFARWVRDIYGTRDEQRLTAANSETPHPPG